MARYRYTGTYADTTACGVEAETEVAVEYGVVWGSPETGAGYMACPYRYDPGSPDEIDGVTVLAVNGQPVTDPKLRAYYEAVADAWADEMIAAAAEHEEARDPSPQTKKGEEHGG